VTQHSQPKRVWPNIWRKPHDSGVHCAGEQELAALREKARKIAELTKAQSGDKSPQEQAQRSTAIPVSFTILLRMLHFTDIYIAV